MFEPSSMERNLLAVRECQCTCEIRRERNDVIGPKNRFDLADILLLQVLLMSALHAVDVLQD